MSWSGSSKRLIGSSSDFFPNLGKNSSWVWKKCKCNCSIAFETLLALNNKYFLDGRDPNSYAGVAWVFGKHDTAWTERPIFGKTRYMNAAGLKRKCDITAYVEKVKRSA